MSLNKEETKLIDESIAAYKRTIKHIRNQIKNLERQKKNESR